MFCIIFIISGYNYYQPYTEYSPSYHYSYGYPSYVAGAEAGNIIVIIIVIKFLINIYFR